LLDEIGGIPGALGSGGADEVAHVVVRESSDVTHASHLHTQKVLHVLDSSARFAHQFGDVVQFLRDLTLICVRKPLPKCDCEIMRVATLVCRQLAVAASVLRERVNHPTIRRLLKPHGPATLQLLALVAAKNTLRSPC
jgi:hypothetical protein